MDRTSDRCRWGGSTRLAAGLQRSPAAGLEIASQRTGHDEPGAAVPCRCDRDTTCCRLVVSEPVGDTTTDDERAADAREDDQVAVGSLAIGDLLRRVGCAWLRELVGQ